MKILNSIVLFSIFLPGVLTAVIPPHLITIVTPGDTAPLTGGNLGDLRYAINYINQNIGAYGYTINFALGAFNTITYGGEMPILGLTPNVPMLIDGTNGGTEIILDGAGAYGDFLLRQGLERPFKISRFKTVLLKAGQGDTAAAAAWERGRPYSLIRRS